jgi:2-polyprenyl-6-methoxyphenol hydroxylase-like FAD-dependent oxidoreductase
MGGKRNDKPTGGATGKPADGLRVLVIGGGIGGLCLAQGLKRAGTAVRVFERNRSRDDWLQGYRIHISPHGSRALHACLPPDAWQAFLDTAGKPSGGFGFLTEQLDELLFFGRDRIGGGDAAGPVDSHHSASRITLRQVLLSGLGGEVEYDREFVRYEQNPDGTVTVFFAGGGSATGDVLVAADGANSRVRAQFLPQARRIDTGVLTVAGKLLLDEESRAWLPPRLYKTVNNIMPRDATSMFVAVWEGDRTKAPALAGVGGNDPAAGLPPGMLFDHTRDYLIWGYSARRESYPAHIAAADPAGEALDGRALQRTVLDRIDRWHPGLRRLVAESDSDTVRPVRIRSMEPVRAWQTGTVTLIGDAIHNMTPMAGIGANTALRDADLLCRKLVEADRGRAALLPAIAEYEAAMLDYGFAAVKLSLANAKRATSGGAVSRTLSRATLRTINALPPVKARMGRSLGS